METSKTYPDPELSGFAEASSDDERVQWLQTHLDSLGPLAADWLLEQLWLISDGNLRRDAYRWVLPLINKDALPRHLNALSSQPLNEQLPILAMAVPLLPEAERPELCNRLIADFGGLLSGPDLIEVVTQIAPYIPTDLHLRAIDSLRQSSDEPTRVQALAALAPVLEVRLRHAILDEALSLARSQRRPMDKVISLIALIPVLNGHLQEEVTLEAWYSLQQEGQAANRTWLISELLPWLDESLAGEAIGLAFRALSDISDNFEKADELVRLAEALPVEAISELEHIATGIENSDARARAYLGLEAVQQRATIELKAADMEAAIEQDQTEKTASNERPETASSAYQSVPTHLDQPADLDRLNRRPFAEVIAVSMRQAFRQMDQHSKAIKGRNQLDAEPEGDAYMVHLHGQWGAGKSSVLNFLREALTEPDTPENPAWLVITFNAWRHQHLGPPWWALINTLYGQGQIQLQQLDKKAARRLRWLDWRWRFRTRLGPLVLTGALALWGLSLALGQSGSDIAGAVRRLLEVAAVILGVSGTLLGGFRTLFLGSAQSAKLYTELSRDPMQPILDYYQRLVQSTGRPIAIFIDDLDRCDCDYVVSLLSGIQTLFRNSNVSYVVAADRDWLRSCYEKHYRDFGNTIGEPGRPLGYLFLEKVFQVSVGLPRLSAHAQTRYLSTLLAMGESEPESAVLERERQAEHLAEAELQETISEAEFSERIQQSRHDPLRQRAMRVAAAKRMLTPEVQRHTEHALQPYANLLEPNPRAMKRLVNAFGFQQAVNWLSERDVPQHPLVLWTLIQMRWPLLADTLARHPDTLTAIGQDIPLAQVPANLHDLFRSPEVLAVVQGRHTGQDDAPLTPEQIRHIVGTELAEADAGVR